MSITGVKKFKNSKNDFSSHVLNDIHIFRDKIAFFGSPTSCLQIKIPSEIRTSQKLSGVRKFEAIKKITVTNKENLYQ